MFDWENASDDWNEAKKEKKEYNYENSVRMLKENNINFKVQPNGSHLVVESDVDYWPSTGKFIHRGSGKSGRGIRNLLTFLKNKPTKNKVKVNHPDYKEALAKFREDGINFEIMPSPYHIVVEGKIDFWPTTGKFKVRENGESGNGLNQVLQWLSKLN